MKKRLQSYLYNLIPNLKYILKIQVTALVFLTMLRLFFLLFNTKYLVDTSWDVIVEAFFIGFHFDNLVATIITLPILCLSLVVSVFKRQFKPVRYFYNTYYAIIYFIVFGFSVSDIPYYQYFLKHIDISIKTWMQFGGHETYNMLYTESSYFKYYFLFFAVFILFILCIKQISRQLKNNIIVQSKKNKKLDVLCVLILLFLCGISVSRKYGKEALTLKTSYFSSNFFVNELSINSVYYFFRSLARPVYQEKMYLEYVSLDEAINIVKQDLQPHSFIENISPVARHIIPQGDEIRANVVIVLMESMSSQYITKMPELTPNLNSLIDKSYYFENIYSSGTHTNQGIFATLYGFPAFLDKNITDNRGINRNNQINEHLPVCEGFPFYLENKGYTSSFYISHSKTFDNLDVFLSKNGIVASSLFSIDNYPQENIVNTWGVDDCYLFEFAIKQFNQQEKPFFAGIMTITNHPPYTIPNNLKAIGSSPEEQAVYTADHCIGNFLEEASKQDWYSNTIFVFVGDHGRIIGNNPYGINLPYNQIPLIIYSPLLENVPQKISKYGGQIDVLPTVMGILNFEYVNNSLGIDLLKYDRGYTVFSSDVKLATIDNESLYLFDNITNTENVISLDNDRLSEREIIQVEELRKRSMASFIVTNHILKHRLSRREQ